MPDITIDGTSVSAITIDGTSVKEVTIDGSVAWTGVTVIDDFESQWSNEQYYTGDTSEYNDSSSNVKHGSYRMYTSVDNYSQISSTSGLPAYPSQGDEVQFWAYLGDASASTTYLAFIFGYQDSSNFYYIRWRLDGTFELVKKGTGTLASKTGLTASKTTWYQVKLQWDDGATFGGNAGDMTAYLYDASGNLKASITGNDTAWSSGGIGWGATDTATSADYLRITN